MYNTPIYDYLRRYAEEELNIFHMPGHKLGRGVPYELAQNLLQLDVTEVEGTDNLHRPQGIIKDAQGKAAKAFGADRTFFLVNGSTCGVQAAIMSVCARGQKLIAGRDSHRSVASGLILSGAEPVYVYPEFNEEFSIHVEITPESIENALRANPDAAAVLITRPNYYGICCNIEEISRLVHSRGKILIVDEAHGAHLAFSDRLPPSALSCGADICIQSAHKTLPAVTQGAYLHVKGNRPDMEKLSFNLAMLQSSSPSYIIMSYLDIAREIMEREGRKRLEEIIDINARFVEELEEDGAYKVLQSGNMGINSVQDPTRLVINVNGLGISGYSAEKVLRERLATQVEMADFENIVLITTVADTRESMKRLLDALETMKGFEFHEKRQNASAEMRSMVRQYNNRLRGSSQELPPWKAYASEKLEIPLESAVGRICADIITPYPPGIPVLYPGEIICSLTVDYISDIISAGGNVNGMGADGRIRVLKE
ncbi:arginine decarboxylase [Ruminiclostridium hungatei]|uniref:Arginine decarboxylase n=1 Tax=Ruminiclostridium hungatei TaxID=48256 RepID=A0A1V4SQS5_RUMHU|nr:aminotransferase class I/II-fold pyridoxal phosphate-dependent enzyme [Ruminiclostridium hungatei]OPX45816.1 arginine decarboxylase [Ruminiclostridium hungatei]